jgi:gas vesicle protein
MENNNNKKVLALALAGLATGAAIWFLMSTDKGKQTRDYLVDSLMDNWQDKLRNFSGKTGKMVDELKKASNSVSMPA